MSYDLELLKQLEMEIGIKLVKGKFSNLKKNSKNGFSIDKRGNITGLNLDGTSLPLFPVILSNFHHLINLSLSYTQIIDISFLENLVELDTLDLSFNRVADFTFLKGLDNLTNLKIRNNRIKNIFFLRNLKNLTILDLRNNDIADIHNLKNLINIDELSLAYNNIDDISFLLGLKNLKRLDLRHNKISKLPKAIVEIEMKIDVDESSFLEVKPGLYLFGNPLQVPPLEILRKGSQAIKNYFQSLKKGYNLQLNELKVLLVGDGGAGKTSLVKQLLGQYFDEEEARTHGINIDSWTFKSDKTEIKARIWDFGGQEIMHATHQFFLSKRSLYILVLDGRKDEKTEYWLKHIESFGGNSPVLVVLNKIDENPGFEVNRKFLKDKYKNILGFYRISCKTREGIIVFAAALEKAISQGEILKTIWASNWFNVKTHLENMPEYFISYKQYQEICTIEAITDESSQKTLVGFLNDLGVVLHYADIELEDTHVLEPKWVTEAVYKIINSKQLADCKGILELNFLDEILRKKKETDYEYPPDKYRYIIQLMKKFELCFEIDREHVLIPDLLEVEESQFDFDYDGALKFILEYDFLPKSVMPRFIVRMHRDIKEELRWRTGVVLEDEDFQSTAVIKADEQDRKIYIYVNGKQKRYYFAVIRHTFRNINHSFEKLAVNERLPVPGEPTATVSYDHLIKMKERGKKDFFPEGAEKEYNIDDLLEGFEENELAKIALNIKKRGSVLDELDDLIFDDSTREKEIHRILETDLWILGTEYSKMSSNETLKRVVEDYLGKKYKGESSKNRPDLLLIQDTDKSYLLIELKRPRHLLDRDDENQALKYKDELVFHLPGAKINIMIIGGGIKKTVFHHDLRSDVKFLSYKDVISQARNNIKWLMDDLK